MDVGMEIDAISESLNHPTTPGIRSKPVTARRYFKRAWTAARDNEERRALL